ncbi:ATP-grasp domain-containing protein [Streptomyces sp. OfavH-34-F]|uniref:preATP grasp domain-containing protein n=1 Tax=Streptomyces sp. OfavH-34-F TaxID=2917760 RepID=UPI001EF16BA1|nr:ATP-grasp domain-containing protein [Streptomyces sp. OfavH-34-F]MCG7525533.1 ATP-grasp domain-containing protein [Streptomyces sp. OfavH-34-F]
MTFSERLKKAATGDPGASFIYLNNFEVEAVWGADEPKLPGSGLSFSAVTVNRMEEVGVLLAEPHDAVVLKERVDPDYLGYLEGLDAAHGTLLMVDDNTPEHSVTEDALVSPDLLATLKALDDGRTYLAPLGISEREERLSRATGLPLAGPPAEVCRRVNGKIYSRELTEDTGLATIPGTACRTVDELAGALRLHLGRAGRVVVKESLGVSGRGMVVLDSPDRAARLVRMIARRGADAPVRLVVEEWIEKDYDLNYQFLLARDGTIGFETVKRALTENGVHRGHAFPPDLPGNAEERLRESAETIGARLHAEGYFGLVGVDALMGADGRLHPCLEINARFNMATYQNRFAERFVAPGQHALAGVIDLKPTRRHTFLEVREALDGLLYDEGSRSGLLVNNFSTLNAAVAQGRRGQGRLYGIAVADSAAAARDIHLAAEDRLVEMTRKA